MGKYFSKPHTFLNKLMTFFLMITLSVGTTKGRTAVNTVVDKLKQLDWGIKIGFRVFLYLVILLILFWLKKWLAG